MKKKNVFILVMLFVVISLTSGIFIGLGINDNSFKEEVTKKGTFKNTLSMMLENEAGEYVSTTSEEWPTTGYKFNSKLSKCESGGKVSWDYANKRVKMTGASSDKCYIYFDKIVTVDSYCDSGDNLASCIKTYGNAGYDKSSIYIHNSSLTNGAGDNSYRFAGPSDYVNNFVCFGSDAGTCPTDNLYRIIGVFGDQVKLIKYDYATSALLGTDGAYKNAYETLNSTGTSLGNNSKSNIGGYYWNTTGENSWSTSSLNTVNLNTNFLNNIGIAWSSMISNSTWKVGGNLGAKIYEVSAVESYQNEIVSPANNATVNAKVGLMYASDYAFASLRETWNKILVNYDPFSGTGANWMYMGLSEWIITRESGGINFAFWIGYQGHKNYTSVNVIGDAIRPTFYLKSSINYESGKGTKESPIRLGDFEITLANVVKEQYTGTQGTNGIYLHNGTIKSGDTVIDTGDNSYRYAGANPDNYVCFGSDASTCPTDNLYRIIGVFGDKVKLIKADFANSNLLGTNGTYLSNTYSSNTDYINKGGGLTTINSYGWSDTHSASWNTSLLNTINLNTNFITYLNNQNTKWANKIATTTWKIEGKSEDNILYVPIYQLYQNEIVSTASETYNSKIGLMYVSDYGYAASPTYWTLVMSGPDGQYYTSKNTNWMYMVLNEWTITSGPQYDGYAFYVTSGYVSATDITIDRAVRPVFYLNPDVTYISGEGTFMSPFIID